MPLQANFSGSATGADRAHYGQPGSVAAGSLIKHEPWCGVVWCGAAYAKPPENVL